MIDWEAGLAAIDAVFGETVTYNGSGLLNQTISVIWADVEGDARTIRVVTCEIDKVDQPNRPIRSDRITRNGVVWAPAEVIDRTDISRWQVVLERV